MKKQPAIVARNNRRRYEVRGQIAEVKTHRLRRRRFSRFDLCNLTSDLQTLTYASLFLQQRNLPRMIQLMLHYPM
jgi:hypothetical protein